MPGCQPHFGRADALVSLPVDVVRDPDSCLPGATTSFFAHAIDTRKSCQVVGQTKTLPTPRPSFASPSSLASSSFWVVYRGADWRLKSAFFSVRTDLGLAALGPTAAASLPSERHAVLALEPEIGLRWRPRPLLQFALLASARSWTYSSHAAPERHGSGSG